MTFPNGSMFSTFLLSAALLFGLSSTGFAQPPSEVDCSGVDYCAAVGELLAKATKIRGLPSPEQIRCRTVSGEQYREITQKLSLQTNSASDLRSEGQLFEMLGVVPLGYDYPGCMLHGSTDSSSALYDRSSKTIVFRSDASLASSLAIHELTHLLQDFNFDIAAHEKLEVSTDARLALAAVREGDAILTEILAMHTDESILHPECGVLEGAGYVASCKPSALLSRILLFPYEQGLSFAELVHQRGGFTAVDRIFKHPPRTSKEILYPSEFFRGELKVATPIVLSQNLLPPGYTVVYRDILGEFFLRELLKEFIDANVARKAAKGWVADTITLSRSADGSLLSWAIQVESDADIAELTEGFRMYVKKRFGITIDPRVSRWESTKLGVTVSLRRTPSSQGVTFKIGTVPEPQFDSV